MHKGKPATSLLHVFSLILLFFLLSLPLLFPALGSPDAQEYDYVDNNTSNVDASPDKGTHSNFTAQQYGPDSIYDTLTEENTGGGAMAIAKVGTATSGTGTALTLSFSHTLVAGSNRLVVVSVGIENGGTIDVDSVTYGGVAMTKAVEGITGLSGFRYLAEIWYILENDLPSDGAQNVVIACSGTVSSLEINGFCAEYTGVNQGAPEVTDNTNEPSPPDATIANTISPSDDSWVVSIAGCGNPGSFTHGQGQVEVLDFRDSSSTFAVAELRGASGETSLSSTYSATANRLERVAVAWNGSVEVNYELALEVQWTNATYDLPNEELCIYGGTMGSENIGVDVWTGSTWHNLFTDLSSGWNNISVTDYLTSSMFTIRFKGGTETGDTSQDSWEIDCTLLHTWGIPPIANFSYTPEYPYTGETMTFNASDSYDPDGTIVSYFWDFGDGTNATAMIVANAYADDGIYTVTLTVTDNDGLSDTTSADVTVINRPPIAIFTESAETVYTGEVITFNASDSYDPDGLIVSYRWNFGDGTNTDGMIVVYSYADDGSYTVTLTITDDDGATASTSATKTVLNRPPIASFTESAETVYTGESISFNATVSYDPDGVIVSYFWDFGDGANATGIIVEHAYADDGVYTVTLTVTDDDGATASVSATKTILNRPPVVIFTESAETVYTGETIAFNASASYDPDGSVVSYFWDFGDGTNAIGVLVAHAYADDGVYSVTLTVTDNDGATGIVTSTKTILNRPPVAIFTESTETAYTNETITFSAAESYDPDGTIVNYFWDFGDGTNATGVIVDHAYDINGTFTVTLTVTDDDDASDSASSTKTILMNEPPVALFTESAETVYTGEAITFNASDSYDPDGVIVGYFWDFGDGTNATGVAVEHTYTDDGNYTVKLTITDDDGATDTASATKNVMNRTPVASFTESATTTLTGEAVYFNASESYDPDGAVVSYFWDFGDGTNATGPITSHSYEDDGNYTVTLTVTDDDGATGNSTASKTVLNRSPTASFTESAETVYTGTSINFNASDSYDPDGSIASYFWDFGDGTNTTGVVVEHVYADNGTYIITLTVTDDDGATASTSATKTVLNRSPVASMTESAETVYTSETISFNASDSYDPDGIIVSHFWDFGDGTNATGLVVHHTYVEDGNYTVTLMVTDNDGATGSTSATKTILNRLPVASFTESTETIYTNTLITFDASDSYDPDGTIVEYFWDFGDGANSTGMVVDHAYVQDGNYTVILMVADDDGGTGTATSTKTVLNRSPVASFTESAETVLTNDAVHFNASDSYDPDGSIVSYFWDFGDGANTTGIAVEHTYDDDGNYTVTLTITDDDGATDTATATKTIANRPPVASFTESATTVLTGETITFNASDSYDPDGIIVSYFWDFGDGTNATGIVVDHAYTENGNYAVTLTITDDDSVSDTLFATKTVLNRPPVSIFTESAETVYKGETITFNASDSYDTDGSIVSYFWDFGDGVNASGVLVEHSYMDQGNYTVTLTIADDDGASGSTSAIKTVLIMSPVAMFTESADTVYTGKTITFDATDSYDPDGSIVSYFWDFGDGTNGTGVTVGHAYADDGNYTVTLTVTDDEGATGSSSAMKTILNRHPVASFAQSATTVYTGQAITFDASESYDLDGTIVEYLWNFGDSTNATGVIVEHAYADDGTYTVILTVTDDDGATGSASGTTNVLNRSPVVLFTESAETVYTGEIIYFNASSSYDPDGTIISYFWDFGDGTNTTEVVVEHAYIENGNYTVTLTVTDDDSVAASTSSVKSVLNQIPIALFTESAESVVRHEIIYFNASSSYDPDGTIVSYFWDFGDGTNTTGVFVEHFYYVNGTFTVTLSITDNDEDLGTTAATKTVLLNEPPVALFTESAYTIYQGENITFDASNSYDPDGTIVSFFWDFGDGTNTTGIVVEHIYVDDGRYDVRLTVTDDKGAKDTAIASKNVMNKIPVASFTMSPTTVYTGEIVTFNASDSYDPDGNIISYFWDFGDGTNATGIVATHAYDDDGDYTVTLTVADDDGGTGSSSATKTILNWPPVAMFTMSSTTVYTGEIVTFNASDSYDPDGNIISYFWDFGDGTNAHGEIAHHVFSDNRLYLVTLSVVDNDLVKDTAEGRVAVLNRSPMANFIESAETTYVGTPIEFNASDSYDPDGTIVSFFWDFGDGTNTTGIVVEHIYYVNGTFTVTLTVTDDDGASDVKQASKTTLENAIPIASFTESAETVHGSQTIVFNGSSSYDPDGSIVEFFWDFGDGFYASGVVVEHAYSEDGTYTVTLMVTDDKGALGLIFALKTVLNRSPVALFTESSETVYTGESITFDATDSYDPDGIIDSYLWDFGNGTNATGITISHTYSFNGTFIVTLTVIDNDDASSSIQATKNVLPGGTRDVSVVNVTPYAPNVYRGRTLNVTVVASNEGMSTESFNVTLCYRAVRGWHLVEADGHLVWFCEGEDSADFLLLTSLDIPTVDPLLTFETKYNTESLWDFGFIQISRDGGATWSSLENEYTTYDHGPGTYQDIIENLPGLTGSNPEWPNWTKMTFSLTEYAGETVLLGFRYMSDVGTQGEGWYIDQVGIDDHPISNEDFEQFNPPTLHDIQTQTINNLAPGSQTSLTFSWNTTNVTPAEYIISATAIPLAGETDIVDNTYVDGIVNVKICPDVDGDGDVDLYDAVKLFSCYGAKEGSPNYDPICDLNDDGWINLYDAVILLSQYGQTLE